jgi:MoaA/NifB/PqqE/SkfB family radical SAM enzyme
MFLFNQLKQVHLEITNNCQASCPMCARNIHGGLDNPHIIREDWTLDEFKHIFNEELLAQLEGMYFCGNFGDPLLNKDLVGMCQHVTDLAPQNNLRIHTNGSLRTPDWWADLVQHLPKLHRVVFALDGLADTHSLYRVGTSFDKVIENAIAFIKAGGIAEWCFIKFKHNEHQVEQAEQMAKDLGFQYFTMKNSSRFIIEPRYSVVNRAGEHEYYIEPPTTNTLHFIRRQEIDAYKDLVARSAIECYVQHIKEVYIDAQRNLFPCCWTSSPAYTYIEPNDYAFAVRQEIVDQYHEYVEALGGIERLNVMNSSVKDIVSSNEYQTAWTKFWQERKLIICARMCGKMDQNSISKPNDQFLQVKQINE